MFSPLPAFVRSFVLSKFHFFEIEILFELFFCNSFESVDRSIGPNGIKKLKNKFWDKEAVSLSWHDDDKPSNERCSEKTANAIGKREREDWERERDRERRMREWEIRQYENARERESGWKIQRERLFEVRKKCVLLWVRKGEREGKTERELRDCVVRERERESKCATESQQANLTELNVTKTQIQST